MKLAHLKKQKVGMFFAYIYDCDINYGDYWVWQDWAIRCRNSSIIR